MGVGHRADAPVESRAEVLDRTGPRPGLLYQRLDTCQRVLDPMVQFGHQQVLMGQRRLALLPGEIDLTQDAFQQPSPERLS